MSGWPLWILLASQLKTDPIHATLEVLDPGRVAGNGVLTLADLVGPEADPGRRGLPEIRWVFVVRVASDDVRRGLPPELRTLLDGVDQQGALSFLIVVPGAADPDRVRQRLEDVDPGPWVLALDPRGLSAYVLGLPAPGTGRVIFADGRSAKLDGPLFRLADQLEAALSGPGLVQPRPRSPNSRSALSQ